MAGASPRLIEVYGEGWLFRSAFGVAKIAVESMASVPQYGLVQNVTPDHVAEFPGER